MGNLFTHHVLLHGSVGMLDELMLLFAVVAVIAMFIGAHFKEKRLKKERLRRKLIRQTQAKNTDTADSGQTPPSF